MRRPLLVAVIGAIGLAVGCAALAGCVELGVDGDGTTVSWGPPNRGVLIDGVQLPLEGDGFVVHPVWAARGTQWGTDELVDAIRNDLCYENDENLPYSTNPSRLGIGTDGCRRSLRNHRELPGANAGLLPGL